MANLNLNPARAVADLIKAQDEISRKKMDIRLNEVQEIYKDLELCTELSEIFFEKDPDGTLKTVDFTKSEDTCRLIDEARTKGLINHDYGYKLTQKEFQGLKRHIESKCNQLPQQASAKMSFLQELFNNMFEINKILSSMTHNEEKLIDRINQRTGGTSG